jgi:hypothetical protein
MRSQTLGTLTLGRQAAYTTSTRQKLNTQSSMESKFVAVSNIMGHVQWIRNFLVSQGVLVGDNVVYQDNKRAIILEHNGRLFSVKRTRHINVRYFCQSLHHQEEG